MNSQHQTALFTKHLAHLLKALYVNSRLVHIYSNSKTQLVIETDLKEIQGRYWVLDFSTGQLICTFPDREFNPARGHLLQFKQLHGKKITELNWVTNERAIEVSFSKEQKLFIGFYGRRADVICCESNSKTNFRQFLFDCPQEQKLDLNAKNWEEFWQKNRFLPLQDEPIPYSQESAQAYYKQHFSKDLSYQNDSILIAEDRFGASITLKEMDVFGKSRLRHFHQQRVEKEKAQRLAKFQKQVNQKLAKAKNKLLSLEKSNRFQYWGDLIMSNLPQIKPGLKKQELTDYLTGAAVEVTFLKDLTPIENANKYYQKAKNAHKEIRFLEQKIKQLEKELEKQTPPPLKQIQKQQHALPFWEFQHGEFEIRVGKSAEKNDEMLRKHSHKYDTWLHAKDVAGSHVLIRNPNNLAIPKETLEYAASIAAKYSKSKGQTLAAVIFTPRKYVRKNKRLLAGQVLLDQEEVLLVKPAD